MTTVAFRALLEDEADDLSKRLNGWLIALSERRRYIQREPFLKWLREKCATTDADKGQK
jgi:hypothetical protein